MSYRRNPVVRRTVGFRRISRYRSTSIFRSSSCRPSQSTDSFIFLRALINTTTIISMHTPIPTPQCNATCNFPQHQHSSLAFSNILQRGTWADMAPSERTYLNSSLFAFLFADNGEWLLPRAVRKGRVEVLESIYKNQ